MADKSVGELVAAQSVTPTDLFVLEQNGTAKKLTGQILENWLVSFADGHGGIQSIAKLGTSGLADTYRITLADTTTFDFVVTNGRGVSSLRKTGTSGLVDTYTFTYNDGTKATFTVTNGQKGDKGDNAYIWIKYASQEPTEASHSFGDVPDKWIGFYWGNSSTAPTDWTQYKWYQFKGDKGDTGEPATLVSSEVRYQASDSGTIIPSGVWSSSVPVVAQGKYLWTRTTTTFNTGSSVVSYSVSRMGLDGSGSVSSVANISPDGNGNVPLTAENINALPNTGGDLTGELRMNGQTISGLNAPTANDQAANMGFVNQQVKKAARRNLLDNSNFEIAQAGYGGYHGEKPYIADRWLAETEPSSCNRTDGKCEFGGGESYLTVMQKTTKEIADSLIGKTVTLAVKDGNGTIYCNSGVVNFNTEVANIDCGAFSIRLHFYANTSSYQLCRITVKPNQIASICWTALYEGEYTIDTLPEYQPKGYAAELMECRRYFYRTENSFVIPVTNDDWLAGGIQFPIPLRTDNITVDNLRIADIAAENVNLATDGTVVYRTKDGIVAINNPGKFAGMKYCFVNADFSADL